MSALDAELTQCAHALGQLLRSTSKRLVTAESCTGGLIASICTGCPGSSAWFWGGYVTYTLAAKHAMLGVDSNTLENWGVVSQPVARAMAEGALRRSDAQVAVAVTGLAGPTGGEPDRPVGTVWLGWVLADSEMTRTQRYEFDGDRESIRRQAALVAFSRSLELLSEPAL